MTAEGRTIVFVSHKLDELMAVSDRVTVLRAGKLIGTVNTPDTDQHALARMMIGREVVFTQAKKSHDASRETALELKDVSARDDLGLQALHNVSLSVHHGEIVGVAGVAGNGQRQLAGALSGARPRMGGGVGAKQRKLRPGAPDA